MAVPLARSNSFPPFGAGHSRFIEAGLSDRSSRRISMISLKVITATTLPATPGDVWPLLVDSRMDRRPRSPVFYLGVPRPVECALPSGVGGVGAARECRAAEGVIRQRITRWQPASVLEFRMQETDLPFRVPPLRGRDRRAVRADGTGVRSYGPDAYHNGHHKRPISCLEGHRSRRRTEVRTPVCLQLLATAERAATSQLLNSTATCRWWMAMKSSGAAAGK